MSQSLRLLLLTYAALVVFPAGAQSTNGEARRDAALRRLEAVAGGARAVSVDEATGAARFVRLQRRGETAPARTAEEKAARSAAFFREHGVALGVDDAASLRLVASVTDGIGETHLTWKQFHGAVPVFAGVVKTHFDAAHRLKAVTGTAIPDITVNESPIWSAADAMPVALAAVAAQRGSARLGVGSSTLYVYREGLARGVPGPSQLAWEIEVTNGANVRELVYVGAHTGKIIDRVTGIHDDMFRRAYDGHSLPFAPENYPNGAYWLEGQRYPTVSQEANNMLLASGETYGFFMNAFGRDSFDGEGATMDSIFNRGYDCPNASWNGTFISFCPGLTTDDVTAHEWGHAYTQYTHDLIYEWQPGALNESYSDIWGETVDVVNGRGGDSPFAARTAGACSTESPPVGRLVVNGPATLAGTYFAQAALFGPQLTAAGITGDVVAAIDAADAAGPSTVDGCSALANAAAVSGKIALIQRGACEFSTKVLNAQNAGAIAAIIDNNTAGGLPGMGPGAVAGQVTIPSLGIQQADGAAIRAALAAGDAVNATLLAQPGTDASVRWLMGEDSVPPGFDGALRDMWNPTCYGNPGKVTDTVYYACGTGDGGGVHTNSGVPNHAYALLVDGGTYNGRTVGAIGLTKAAHVYFRAQDAYQVPASDFADHADALEASCADLVGQPLAALTGGPSGETISLTDCQQVATAIAAVELRTPPTSCNFPTILNPALPALCSAATTTGTATGIASYDFEAGAAGFTATRGPVSAGFTPRDWTLVSELPSPETGSAFFAPDPNSACAPDSTDESGVLHLTSPAVALPAFGGDPIDAPFARATFEHWFATEPGFDGGNLSVSVNGGPWQLVPPSQITFNNYNVLLLTAAEGNSNPLAGQASWSGTNPGTVVGGSWGRTHVNLGNLARPGDTLQLRWSLGTDGCAGRVGWYVDDVNVFSCVAKIPALTVADLPIVEGDAGESEVRFTVSMSTPTIRDVTVTYEVVDGTAQHGNDFAKAAGTLVIRAGTSSGTIPVVIKGDVVAEGVETFTLELHAAQNATIADDTAIATIDEDD